MLYVLLFTSFFIPEIYYIGLILLELAQDE